MTRPPDDDRSGTEPIRAVDRRRFLAAGGAIGVTLLAGCAGNAGTNDSSATPTTTALDSADVGQFRLLISDRPADIGDFEELTVTLSHARVFRNGDPASGTGGDDDATDDQESTAPNTTEPTGTTTTEETTTEQTTEASTSEQPTTGPTAQRSTSGGDETTPVEQDDEGFFRVDLDGATVDLTRVVGEKAIEVLDGKLPTGRYTKIELHTTDVVGIVEGEEVDVKLPSGKLQLTKPFVVTADEPVSFVFDINVVQKGNREAYNLLPVISESGVAGKDVQVEVISADEATADGTGSGPATGTPANGTTSNQTTDLGT
ncbi:MAG: DUF4382 domain-containing protein [Halanaeroarchaeum sp.]